MLLDGKMPVYSHSLRPGDERAARVEVPPAGLNQSHFRTNHHHGNGAEKKVLGRDKIRVEDGEKLGVRFLHPLVERAGLIADPLLAPDNGDVVARSPKFVDDIVDDHAGFVCGVIQDLDDMASGRVLHGGGGPDDPLGNVRFVENRELGRNPWILGRHGPALEAPVHLLDLDVCFPAPAQEKGQDEV